MNLPAALSTCSSLDRARSTNRSCRFAVALPKGRPHYSQLLATGAATPSNLGVRGVPASFALPVITPQTLNCSSSPKVIGDAQTGVQTQPWRANPFRSRREDEGRGSAVRGPASAERNSEKTKARKKAAGGPLHRSLQLCSADNLPLSLGGWRNAGALHRLFSSRPRSCRAADEGVRLAWKIGDRGPSGPSFTVGTLRASRSMRIMSGRSCHVPRPNTLNRPRKSQVAAGGCPATSRQRLLRRPPVLVNSRPQVAVGGSAGVEGGGSRGHRGASVRRT